MTEHLDFSVPSGIEHDSIRVSNYGKIKWSLFSCPAVVFCPVSTYFAMY